MGRTLDKKVLTLAVTGGIATGKSIVNSMLARLGAKTVSADKIVHRVLPLKKAALKGFGPGVVGKDGRINRRLLGRIVFKDKRKRARLNKLIHPQVKKEIKRIVREAERKDKTRMVAVEVPLLFEAGMAGDYDRVLVVSCRRDQQLRRVKKKFKLKKREALTRITSQWPLAGKKKRADIVIDNSGTLSATRKQVREAWEKLV